MQPVGPQRPEGPMFPRTNTYVRKGEINVRTKKEESKEITR